MSLYKKEYTLNNVEDVIKSMDLKVEPIFIPYRREISKQELDAYKNTANILKQLVKSSN